MVATPPGEPVEHEPDDEPVRRLRRWHDAGGVWRVVGRTGDRVTITLHTCDGGEEMGRFSAAGPGLIEFLGDRRSSED